MRARQVQRFVSSGLTSAREAFHHLKAALCDVATWHVPQFDRPFYIRTDASRYAIGAVLEQVDEATGDHYPLAFWSRKLAPRQMQWSPREQETYAIICALKKYQSWVGTNRVEVLTDHRSLEYWATEHIDTVASPAGRRARWHEFLSLFDLHVSYLPGKHNTVADCSEPMGLPRLRGAAKYQHPWYGARTAMSSSNGIRKKRNSFDVHACSALSNSTHCRVTTSRPSQIRRMLTRSAPKR